MIITPEEWDTTRAKHTYIAKAIWLLMAVFDTATLLNSNLKGERSKINKESGKHQALNPDLIRVIKCKNNKEK